MPKHKCKYLYMSDTHIGHEKFLYELFDKAVKTVKKEKPDFIIHVGDHLEGMSNRPGHIYELNKVGFSQQIEHAADLYNQFPKGTPMYGIDGNHDQWYYKPQNMGVVVGDELEQRVKSYKNLGQDEADIVISPKVKLKLFHGNDGSAYAVSYKMQKLIESLTGGEKPQILHSGHYHKALYMFLRNVHGFESGTLCGQSKWMRGKKIPAHTGFGVVEVTYDKGGNVEIDHKFIPDYRSNK